jgi:hypothetical protein
MLVEVNSGAGMIYGVIIEVRDGIGRVTKRADPLPSAFDEFHVWVNVCPALVASNDTPDSKISKRQGLRPISERRNKCTSLGRRGCKTTPKGRPDWEAI